MMMIIIIIIIHRFLHKVVIFEVVETWKLGSEETKVSVCMK